MKLVLLGGGGHGSDVLGLVEDIERLSDRRFGPIAVADDAWTRKELFVRRGAVTIDGIDNALAGHTHYVAAAGYPALRRKFSLKADKAGLAPAAALVHPMANVNLAWFRAGAGTVVLGMCSISPGVDVGSHCYISHAALIGHDTVIGNYATIMPGASISGDAVVGMGAMVGAGAIVLEGVTLGEGCIVGAGAVVVRDVEPHTTVMGIPARPRSKES